MCVLCTQTSVGTLFWDCQRRCWLLDSSNWRQNQWRDSRCTACRNTRRRFWQGSQSVRLLWWAGKWRKNDVCLLEVTCVDKRLLSDVGSLIIDNSCHGLTLWHETNVYLVMSVPGLGFCHGKKYFCQDSGKTGKNHGKNRQKLALSLVH